MLAPLPDAVRRTIEQFLSAPFPDTPEAICDALGGRLSGAGIAEGRGGYPGGWGIPDRSDYLVHQCDCVAALRAVADHYAISSGRIADILECYEPYYPPVLRLLGGDEEPHVDRIVGKPFLVFPLDPVRQWGWFRMEIASDDLAALESRSDRRLAFYADAERLLRQRLALKAAVPVAEIRALLDRVEQT